MLGTVPLFGASPAPPTDQGVEAGDNSSAPSSTQVPSPTRVWNSTSRESALTISAKLQRYARRVVKKFDRNGSGALEASEWASLPGNPRKIDQNGDGVITVDELAAYLAKYARLHPLQTEETAWQHLPQPPAVIFQPATPADQPRANAAGGPAATPAQGDDEFSPGPSPAAKKRSPDEQKGTEAARRARKYYVAPSTLPRGLPDWFMERDTDGDGQLTIGEFAPDGSAAQRRLFAEYDQNGDGVITPEEVMRYLRKSSENAKPSPEAKPSTEGKASAEAKTSAEKTSPSSAAREPGGSSSP